MVGTRTSLPAASARDDDAASSASPDPPPADGMSKKARAALKKLQIDGKGAMVGEKPEQEEFETYHWRGAVYAVSKGTKREWVEQEPERYKRRKVEAETAAAKEAGRRDSGYGQTTSEEVAPARSEGKKRKVRFEEGEKSGRKRKRSMRASTDDEDEVEPRRRKKRKNLDGSRTRGASPSPPPPARSRQAAAAPGPVVAPLHKRIPQLPRNLAAQPSLPTATRSKVTASSSPANNTASTSTMPANPHHATENLRSTQRNLLELARQNTQHERLMQQMRKIRLLQRLRELRRERGGNDEQAVAGAGDPSAAPPADAPPAILPPIHLGDPTSFLLNDRLSDPERAESEIFASVRAAGRAREGRSSRRRRANREVGVVRGWDLLTPPGTQVGDEVEEEGSVAGGGGEGEADGKTALGVEELPDEWKGRLGLLSEGERDAVKEGWLGIWSPPRPDGDGEGEGGV